MGHRNPLCTLGEMCGKGLAMEPNGDVYTCDHYVYPEYKIGNIAETELENMAFSAKQQQFGTAKSKSLPKQCRECNYKFACFGECPKNRFIKTKEGENGLNYLCAGWNKFFRHADAGFAFTLRRLGLPVAHGKHSDQALIDNQIISEHKA